MNKFIITGSYRSGTTYLSSILNSQTSTFCFEQSIFHNLEKDFSNQEEFLCFSNQLDARFMSYGLPMPQLHKKAKSKNEITYFYIEHLKNTFNCTNVGFKKTMLTRDTIKNLVNDNYKIIIMKRPVEKILKSWLNRIEPNLNNAALKLQNFLKEINYYSLDFLSPNSFKVVDYDALVEKPEFILKDLSRFLEFEIKLPTELIYSLNKPTNLSHSFKEKTNKYTTNSSIEFASSNSLPYRLPKKYSDKEIHEVSGLVQNGKFKLKLKNLLVNKFKVLIRLIFNLTEIK